MRPCPICQSTSSRTIGTLQNTFPGPQSRPAYDLVECAACDLIYLSPLPLPSDLDAIYLGPQFDYYTEETIRPAVEFYGGRIRALSEALGKPQKLSVLEIGAGPAWLSRAAKEVEPASFTVAQDVTPEMAAKCPWVDRYLVTSADSSEIDAAGPYDVISLTHVIEHLPDPVGMLRRIRKINRGLIFITAPHRPVAWKGTIEEWASYSYNHVPAHLQYFSEKAMRAAAATAGLELRHWDATSEDGQAFEAWLR